MEISFPETGYVGVLSFFSCAIPLFSVNIAPIQNIPRKTMDNARHLQDMCRTQARKQVLSCTF